jgi:hypothetical protein
VDAARCTGSLSPTSENRLKTKIWLNACRSGNFEAKIICQTARESHALCPDSGALGFPTKQNIFNPRCAKGAQKWRMTTQGQIRLSYATSSIFVGWWRNAASRRATAYLNLLAVRNQE